MLILIVWHGKWKTKAVDLESGSIFFEQASGVDQNPLSGTPPKKWNNPGNQKWQLKMP